MKISGIFLVCCLCLLIAGCKSSMREETFEETEDLQINTSEVENRELTPNTEITEEMEGSQSVTTENDESSKIQRNLEVYENEEQLHADGLYAWYTKGTNYIHELEGNYSGFPIENEEDFKMSLERLKPLIGYESFDDEFEYAGNNTFQQVYKGVPVYRSVVKVRTDENMLPIELSVSYKNNISIPTTEPGITIEQAYEFINEYDIYYAEEDMQLYIIDMDMDETYYKLSWVVTVSENYPHLAGGKEYPGETVYCLDARNGDLLRRYEMVVDVDF